MKVKILKNKYGYVAGNEVEVADAVEAKDLVDKGFAEEVKVDYIAEATKTIEDNLNKMTDGMVEKISTEAALKTIEKVNKGLGKRRNIVVGPDNITLDPTAGFKSFGRFAAAVVDKAMGKDTDNAKLIQKAGIVEQTDGVLVPTQYSDQFFAILNSEDYYANLAYPLPTNTETFKLDIDSLVTIGTNAVTGGWVSSGGGVSPYDGNQATEKGSGIANQISFSLNKYMTLVGVSDEMLGDQNVQLPTIVDRKAMYDIVFNVNDCIINGTGSGQPQGIVGSAATIAVVSDTTDEYVSGVGFSFKDMRNMLAAFRKVQGKSNPVWFIGYDSMPAVWDLKDDSGRSLFIPSAGGQIANAPYGQLMGIPIVVSDHCQSFGTKGDIILADMGAYIFVTKAGQEGVQAAQSVHLWFDKDKTALRFTIRCDGRPGLNAPLKLKNNNTKLMSPFVTLATRT